MRLIDADAFKHTAKVSMPLLRDNPETLIDIIDHFPTVERPHGEWIDKGEYAECSICGANSGTQFDGVEPIPLKTNFCPNCGADMRKEGEENE